MNKQPSKDYVSGYVYMGWVSVVGSSTKVACDAMSYTQEQCESSVRGGLLEWLGGWRGMTTFFI